ncbi:cytochrome P450 [Arhodomonas sp. SL1]|uniref:cytochrome P450 n=1 Tax=Arhodomonas sp. SL1 TaxID=3425691 RepID=UPI003F88556C
MPDLTPEDREPTTPETRDDPLAAWDALRERCPVAYDERTGWTLLRHAEVERALHEPDIFSNAVSQHLSVPNGMDPPEHTAFRALVEPYFTRGRVAAFEPDCRRVAERTLAGLQGRRTVEWMDAVAGPFAARAQCAFLGWPEQMAEPLREWTARNQQATRVRDRATLAELAREFESYVTAMIRERQQAAAPAGDITDRLLAERVDGRPLRREELVSLLRNWTVGEVGTLSAAVGILAHHIATDTALQESLRSTPERIPAAVEEILRVDGPLPTNRRRTTRAVEIGGRHLPAGAPVSLHWIAANRDPRAFPDATSLCLERDQGRNLLYGAGIHVCPGAALARMELRVAVETLLEATEWIRPDADRPAVRAAHPAAGFAALPVRLR